MAAASALQSLNVRHALNMLSLMLLCPCPLDVRWFTHISFSLSNSLSRNPRNTLHTYVPVLSLSLSHSLFTFLSWP